MIFYIAGPTGTGTGRGQRGHVQLQVSAQMGLALGGGTRQRVGIGMQHVEGETAGRKSYLDEFASGVFGQYDDDDDDDTVDSMFCIST